MRSRKAVALSYSPLDVGPRITATGAGPAAERILAIAREAGVPIIEDKTLAELLEPLDFGSIVPEEYWQAVANVLAFVMEVEEGS